jgi:hypothetical protein
MSIAEYVLSSFPGDIRTSTLMFRRRPLATVLFDDRLAKHQDWDLAIRFSDGFRIVCDVETTVALHADVPGRMSERADHAATWQFLEKHLSRLSERTSASVFAKFALATLIHEGRTPAFVEFYRAAQQYRRHATVRDAILIEALSVGPMDGTVLRATRAYLHTKRWLYRLTQKAVPRENAYAKPVPDHSSRLEGQ